MDRHIILSDTELYAIIDLVKHASRTRGVTEYNIWESIA
jgi:hypothetical protein